MRHPTLFAIASLLSFLATAGCGSETSSGTGASGGSGGAGGGGGGAGGGGDPCAGVACGAMCNTCPEGAPCIPQACNAEGMCVSQVDVVCSPCPTTQPADGDPCQPVGLVCETEEGVVLVCRGRTTCTMNGWLTIAPGCSSQPNPEPGCPSSEPAAMAMCDVNVDPPLCMFGDNTFCGCSDCLGGPCGGPAEWVCAEPPAPPCPALAPKAGAVCADEGLSCVYGACPLGGTRGGRTCIDGVWTEDIVPCPN